MNPMSKDQGALEAHISELLTLLQPAYLISLLMCLKRVIIHKHLLFCCPKNFMKLFIDWNMVFGVTWMQSLLT